MKDLLLTSRPRFWIYELGTFFIGYILAIKNISDFINLNFFIFFIYFTFPANLLIYGINDIFDYETDKLNPKKQTYEKLLHPKEHKRFIFFILIFNLPFIIYAYFSLNYLQLLFLLLFVFFAVFYSAPPIRAKTKPILDSLFSANHYVFTAIFSYYLIYPNKEFPLVPFLFGIIWSMAMHAYSAVPDIEFDKQAGINTIATFLGKKNTIILCCFFYSIAFILLSSINILFVIGSVPYLILMALSLREINNPDKLFKIYKLFPHLNTLLPMSWSIYYLASKIS
ncbi:MAG: prenyltransferase [Patescibacteria group bacterium]|nr:prenyltransferase [Patescibacteria group bacterium]